MPDLSTDVLIVGAGGAGMYAAIAAAREGASVLLLDKSQVGRGGATIMAQMTVAVALGEQEADSVQLHFQDTLNAGRGLCNQALAYLLCEDGPKRIREMAQWGTRWAREDGHIKQEMAPGHSVKRCCYVDFLNTGPAVAATLRRKVSETAAIRRISNLAVVEILVGEGRAMGAVALNLADGQWLVIEAKAVILAAGGLTKLYERNSASANMGGEAYALALWAGAELIDMEFVQFFPIGHLAPRLVGMDPIMWDPFRYKLGGKLLNGRFEEFIDRYGSTDFGKYNATRDVAAYAILKEVEAGRGTPHGGAYLDFRHVAEADLRAAFGPVIDRLLTNGIDLTKTAVEVGPMAHYHMGGIRVDADMQTRIAGLYAAGEAVGGANGANRLSGNAITEAFVFGERAGSSAARNLKQISSHWHETAAAGGARTFARFSLQRWRRRSDTDLAAGRAAKTHVGERRAVSQRRKIVSGAGTNRAHAAAIAEPKGRRGAALQPGSSRLVRAARHADHRRGDRYRRAGPHREPGRAPARRFSRAGRFISEKPSRCVGQR